MKVKVKAAKQRKTQRDRVLEYLLDGGILTDYNGVQIGVGAVRSRVSELIRIGYPIKKGQERQADFIDCDDDDDLPF